MRPAICSIFVPKMAACFNRQRPNLLKTQEKLWSRGISQQDGSVAGVSAAVLTEIGRRALCAGNCRRTIVIRERAGQEPWPVIVVVADFVRQRIMTNMADMVGSRLRQARRYGQGGQNCGGGEELQVCHRGSPGKGTK